MNLAATKLRERNQCELRWQLLALERFCVIFEELTARFSSKLPATSKPIIPRWWAASQTAHETLLARGAQGHRLCTRSAAGL